MYVTVFYTVAIGSQSGVTLRECQDEGGCRVAVLERALRLVFAERAKAKVA